MLNHPSFVGILDQNIRQRFEDEGVDRLAVFCLEANGKLSDDLSSRFEP